MWAAFCVPSEAPYNPCCRSQSRLSDWLNASLFRIAAGKLRLPDCPAPKQLRTGAGLTPKGQSNLPISRASSKAPVSSLISTPLPSPPPPPDHLPLNLCASTCALFLPFPTDATWRIASALSSDRFIFRFSPSCLHLTALRVRPLEVPLLPFTTLLDLTLSRSIIVRTIGPSA